MRLKMDGTQLTFGLEDPPGAEGIWFAVTGARFVEYVERDSSEPNKFVLEIPMGRAFLGVHGELPLDIHRVRGER